MTARAFLGLAALLVGCGGRTERAAPAVVATGIDTLPADAHVLDLSDGTAVWLTVGREGIDSAGGHCRERGIELRRGEQRIGVPLLYTLDLPMLSDGRLTAVLASHCTRGARYLIAPATGQPTRLLK